MKLHLASKHINNITRKVKNQLWVYYIIILNVRQLCHSCFYYILSAESLILHEKANISIVIMLVNVPLQYMYIIKTHDSESQSQEEAGRTQ